MANKRDFKKYITAVTNAVCQDMMDICCLDSVDCNAVQDAVIEVLKAGELAIIRTGVKFDKTPGAFPEGGYKNARRVFYKALYKKANKEFSETLNAAVKKFNAAIPEQVKAENKAHS